MTPEQREVAERLVADQSSSNLEWSRQVVALLRELLVEPQGEPVATLLEQSRQNCLRNFGPNGLADWIYTDLGELLADAASMAILCKASEQVQRRPLSDEQINRLDTEAIHGGPDSQYAFRFARAVEKAHGITGEQK